MEVREVTGTVWKFFKNKLTACNPCSPDGPRCGTSCCWRPGPTRRSCTRWSGRPPSRTTWRATTGRCPTRTRGGPLCIQTATTINSVKAMELLLHNPSLASWNTWTYQGGRGLTWEWSEQLECCSPTSTTTCDRGWCWKRLWVRVRRNKGRPGARTPFRTAWPPNTCGWKIDKKNRCRDFRLFDWIKAKRCLTFSPRSRRTKRGTGLSTPSPTACNWTTWRSCNGRLGLRPCPRWPVGTRDLWW